MGVLVVIGLLMVICAVLAAYFFSSAAKDFLGIMRKKK